MKEAGHGKIRKRRLTEQRYTNSEIKYFTERRRIEHKKSTESTKSND